MEIRVELTPDGERVKVHFGKDVRGLTIEEAIDLFEALAAIEREVTGEGEYEDWLARRGITHEQALQELAEMGMDGTMPLKGLGDDAE